MGGKQGIVPHGARSSCRQEGKSYSAAANSCLDPSQSPEMGVAASSRPRGGDSTLRDPSLDRARLQKHKQAGE